MQKKMALFLATMLASGPAFAGGGHDTSTTYPYNDNANNANNNSMMNIMGNPVYVYLGGELGWLNADTTGGFTGDNNFWTAAPVVGIRIGQYAGLETSYTWSSSEDDLGGNVDVRNYAVDALGYLPLNDSKTFELVGTVGVGRYHFDASSVPGDDYDTALRYGGGLQYEINPNWSTRVLYRRTDAETGALDGLDAVTWGLTYNFR